jgi:FkbM family methyltransferase
MKNKIVAERIVIGFIKLIPWKFRTLFYRWPWLSLRVRNVLNRILSSSPDHIFTITAGPLTGRRLELNIRYDKSFWLATHEPRMQIALEKIVQPGSAAYDIGAYIGYFTVLLSTLCGPEGKVVAFEPHPGNFEKLTHNISLNQLDNVEMFNIALSDQKGRGTFREGMTSAQGSLIDASRESDTTGIANRLIPVEISTVDEIVLSRGSAPPAVVKIDVEGNEARVLAGMSGVLKEIRPVIFCEIHNRRLGREVWHYLRERRYFLYDIGGKWKRLDSAGHLEARYLAAVPEEKEDILAG